MNSDAVAMVERVLQATGELTRAGVCIYDITKFFEGKSFSNFENDLKRHASHFCAMLRSLPGGRDACIACDIDGVAELANMHKKMFFHTCHAGLTELVLPIFNFNELIAVIFIGQCRIEGQSDYKKVYNKVKVFGANHEHTKRNYELLPKVRDTQLLNGGLLLQSALERIVDLAGIQAIEHYLEQDIPTHTQEALQYIENHYMEQISAVDIARTLHLNECYLARIFKKNTGVSLNQAILRVRISKAKKLLCDTKLPVQNIAMNVGYFDSNYFARRFKAEAGLSPTEFRNIYSCQETLK